MIIISIALFFLLLVLLLRLKIPFAAAILFVGLLLGWRFGLDLDGMMRAAFRTLQQADTLTIIGTVGLVLVFSELLSQSGHLTTVSGLSIIIFGPHRATLLILPALIGLLPMPGGALVSAPMLDEAANQTPMTPDKKTLLNYWFRHIWEYAWPLYPGLMLAAGLAKVSLFTFSVLLAPVAVVAIAVGVCFIFPGIVVSTTTTIDRSARTIARFVYYLLPIGLIVILFLIVQLPIWLCMLISVLWVMLDSLVTRKLSPGRLFRVSFGSWRTYEMVLVVASVLVFVGILCASTLTGDLVSFFQGAPGTTLPLWYNLVAIILFPFIIGLLTGLTLAFVGTTFPIILSTFIPPASVGVLPFVFLAYTAGLAGVMLSPAHLCLILTNQYFGSSLRKVYYYLIPIVLIVLLCALVLFWGYLKFPGYPL